MSTPPLLLILAVFLFGLESCQQEKEQIAVSSVSLNKSSMTLTEGEAEILLHTILPENAANKSVTWFSSKPEVASVQKGIVTAHKAGIATVTVESEDGAKTAMCQITVNAKVYPVESVSLDKTAAELTEGDELTLTATIAPENASNRNVTWSSSDESVATVTADGKVKAVKAGTATITVKTEDGGKTATCKITVAAKVYPVESISLDRTSADMTEGDELTLTATITPANASNRNVTWSSSNESVATVAADGIVTAHKAGKVTITVTTVEGEKSASCEVTVKSLLESVDKNNGSW